jgi:hypothetical protein
MITGKATLHIVIIFKADWTLFHLLDCHVTQVCPREVEKDFIAYSFHTVMRYREACQLSKFNERYSLFHTVIK